MRTLLLACLALACGTAPAPSPPPPPAPPAADWTAIDDFARRELEAQQLVGMALGLVEGGKVVYVQGYGRADRERSIAVDARRTLFRWASMSKMLTGVVATQLATEGALDLDAPIDRYLTSYRLPASYLERCTGPELVADGASHACRAGFAELPLPPNTTITARRLAGHLAGMPHYANGRSDPTPPPARTGDPTVNTGMEWALEYFVKAPLVAIPGQRFSYSTMGFDLLGVVLEKAAHQPLAALVGARIARPLGLAALQPDYEWKALPDRAVGYERDRTGAIVRQGSTDVSWKLGGGGFISTVADLTAFCAALAGDRLLTPPQKELAWTTQRAADGKPTDYGLGFALRGAGHDRAVEHSGSQEKARTMLRLYPRRGLCFVVMSNATYADTARVIRGFEAAAKH